MGDASDSTSKLVQGVRASSQQLLRSCCRLAESLPMSEPHFQQAMRAQQDRLARERQQEDGGAGGESGIKATEAGKADYAGYLNEAAAGVEWPRLLGNFKGIAGQLAELGRRAEGAELKHVVAVPTDPVAQADGTPSMVVPELLRTKRPPEQEAADDRVRKRVKPLLDELPTDGHGQTSDTGASAGVSSMRSKLFRYNSGVEDVLKAILGSKARADLKRKCDATVTEFAVRGTAKGSYPGVDLLIYLHTGRLSAGLKEVPVSTPAGPQPAQAAQPSTGGTQA